MNKQTQVVRPKTPEMEQLLEGGYGFGVDDAKKIIKERDADPTRWPFEEYQKAKALLAAYEATPQVISKRPGWRRRRG